MNAAGIAAGNVCRIQTARGPGLAVQCLLLIGVLSGCFGPFRGKHGSGFENTVIEHARMMVLIERAGVRDSRVLEAMRTVPRHRFVPVKFHSQAYIDAAIPLNGGSRIPSPVLTARMMELLELKGNEKVLNVSTVTGYEAAVLSRIAGRVYSVEMLQELASLAGRKVSGQGCSNVMIKCGDPMAGWEEHAPFDAILVTDCVPSIPNALVNQLKEGGRMVICLGEKLSRSSVRVIVKEDGRIQIEQIPTVPIQQPEEPTERQGRKPGK